VAFEVAAYDASQPLIIDPVLAYSTFLGGSGSDAGIAIALDKGGNAYVMGMTFSTNFPITEGAFQTTFGQVFVTKLNPTGSALLYSTYLGGGTGRAIAVDADGNAYVTGMTFSTNFPTTLGAFQPTSDGSGDAFVTKLDPTGSALLYSTYLGGSGGEEGKGIAVDAAGNAYVMGTTNSGDFPTTTGAFQTTFGGGLDNDTFVTKLNPAGNGSLDLVYSTYLGGSNEDEGRAIAVDAAGNAYVTGMTFSTTFPTTQGAFQPTSDGSGDAFVTKLNPAGKGSADLVYSTFLGGSAFDRGNGIAVDAARNVYVTGETVSTTFPTTPGAFQTTFGGVEDAFVTKLNPAGNGSADLVYSTLLGGGAFDRGNGIAVDAAGSAYVTGETSSPAFPTTPDALQRALAGGRHVFVTKLVPDGSGLAYSTLLGVFDSAFEFGNAIALDTEGSAYVTGGAGPNFLTTAGAAQTIFGGRGEDGGGDAFVAKLSFGNTAVGANVSVQLNPVTVTFGEVTKAGNTTLTTSNAGPPPPAGFKLGNPPTYYDLATTASFSGTVTVCINYTGITFGDTANLKLSHFVDPNWMDTTLSLDTATSTICGSVTSLSPFAIFEAESTNHPPQAICKNVTVTTDPGVCTATSAPVNNGSFDPDAGDAIRLTQAPAGPYTRGTTNVTLTATDSHDATGSCTATVTVVDQEAPSISCPAPQIVECTGPGGATATFSAAASDNCGIPSTSCPASGSTFPLGTTSVLCSATDGSGNSNSCNSSVTVMDTTAPTVSCVPVRRVRKWHYDKDRDDEKEKLTERLFRVSASDICSAYTITLGGNVLADGEIIKITPTARPGIRLVGRDDDDDDRGPSIRRFRVGPGEAVITATDAARNVGSVACPVPQRQGDDD